MGAKATFDPVTRIIKLTEAPSLVDGEMKVFLDVQIDLYGDMKEDWVSTESLRRLRVPIRSAGGDALPGSDSLGDTYFLRDDWDVELYDASHVIAVNGNFFKENGKSPFIAPSGGVFNTFLTSTVSNLVYNTVTETAVSGLTAQESAAVLLSAALHEADEFFNKTTGLLHYYARGTTTDLIPPKTVTGATAPGDASALE